LDKFTFNRLIENPALVKSEHVKALQKIVEQYPYCQPAKILLTKAANLAGHMNYERFLHESSAGMLDRKKLKYWISLTEESITPEYSITPMEQTVFQANNLEKPVEVLTTTPIVKSYKGTTDQDDILRNLEETLSALRQARNVAAGINKDDSELVSVPQVNIFEQVLPYEQLTAPEQPPLEQSQKEEEKVILQKPEWIKRDKKALPQSLINDFIKTEHPVEKKIELFSTPEQTEFFDYKEFATVQKSNQVDRLSKDKEKIDEIAKDFPTTEATPNHIESSQSGDIISSNGEAEFLLNYLEHNKRKRRLKNISKDKVNSILNKFIQDEPSIKPAQKMTIAPVEDDLSETSSRLNNLPASENFAQLLILQGKYSKAIEVFEELILKNPEKKPYFVSRIEDLKNNLYS
jgi:tetratricopeptide (TPR) repeat protein